MTPEQRREVPLGEATFDDIFEELCSRHDAVVILAEGEPGDPDSMLDHYSGGHNRAIGMLRVFEQYLTIRQAKTWVEREEDEEEET